MSFLKKAAFLLAMVSAVSVCAQPDLITGDDVIAIPRQTTRSGNGSLDLRLFTFSGAEVGNEAGLFNGDNANTDLPHSGGADTQFFYESYVTTAGKLKAYYELNFSAGSIDSIMLFLDLNETGQAGQQFNTLAQLDIWLNPMIQENPAPATGDLSSATQSAVDRNFSGGILLATLGSATYNLRVNSQGAGWADYALSTTVNPFDLQDSDILLFHVGMNELNNGAEDIFLSGSYSATDVVIPEPSVATLVVLIVLCVAARNRQNNNR